MLDLYKQYTIPVAGNQQVTAWGDTGDDVTFYVMNQQPQFRTADGKPVFNFFKYQTEAGSQGSEMGGYASFDLEFKVDNATYDQVKTYLQGKGKDPNAIKWGSIPYSDGTARIFIPKERPSTGGGAPAATATGPNTYVTVTTAGKPSLVGDNVVSFMVEIPSSVSAIFEELLNPTQGASPFSGITASYELKFSAQLPPLTCTVTLDNDQALDFVEKSSRTWNTWNTGYDVKNEQDLLQSVKSSSAIKIEWPPSEAHADAARKKEVEDTIRDWAAEQYKDMLSEQIAKIPTPASSTDNPTTFSRSIKDHRIDKKSRVYSEKMAITCTRTPGGQLPTIPEVLRRLKSSEPAKNYFRAIRANDPFFDQMRRIIQPSIDFADLGIKNVQVEIRYPALRENPVCSFDAASTGAPSPANCSWASNYQDKDGKHITGYEYRMVVSYADSTIRPYRPDFMKTDEQILRLTPIDVGILPINVRAGSVKWSDTPEIDVTVSYTDKAGKKRKLPAVTLKENKTEHKIRYAVGGDYDTTKEFEYELVYKTKTGGTFTKSGTQDSLTHFDILVNTAISAELDSFTILRPKNYDLKNVDTIVLNMVYEDPQNKGFVQRESLQIKPATNQPPWEWKVPVITNNTGKVSYSGRVIYANRDVDPVPSTVAIQPGSGEDTFTLVIPKQGRVDGPYSVEVIPGDVDWTKFAEVKVELEYGSQPLKKITFKDGSDNVTWDITPEDGTKYRWRADYIIKKPKFKVEKINWTTADAVDDSYLPLPAVPSPVPA